jgi:hypothetical protein
VTTPASGGGPSPLRVGGLALIGVAVIAAIIGLAGLAANGDPTPTAAPQPAPPTSTVPPEPPPLPATGLFPPTEPLPTDDSGAPMPSFDQPVPGAAQPGMPAPGAPGEQVPPPGGEPAPAPGGAPEARGGAAQPAPAPPAPQAEGGTGNGGPAAPPLGGSSPAGAATDGAGGAESTHMPLRVYNNSTISGLAARAAEDFRRAGWPIDVIDNYPHGIIPTTTVYFRPGTNEEASAQALGQQFGIRVNPRFEGLKEASPGLIVIVTNDYGR